MITRTERTEGFQANSLSSRAVSETRAYDFTQSEVKPAQGIERNLDTLPCHRW